MFHHCRTHYRSISECKILHNMDQSSREEFLDNKFAIVSFESAENNMNVHLTLNLPFRISLL